MLWGNSWQPCVYLEVRHPEWVVVDTDGLQAGVLGAVDYVQRVIWLAEGMTDVQRRCTLAYEIGQLERGPTRHDPVVAVAYARAAADWAARMLVPIEELCMAYASTRCLPGRAMNAEMARLLDVDEPTVRARRRNLTDDEQDAVADAGRGMPVAV